MAEGVPVDMDQWPERNDAKPTIREANVAAIGTAIHCSNGDRPMPKSGFLNGQAVVPLASDATA